MPIEISENVVQELSEYSKKKKEIEVDLEKQEITYGNKSVKFNLDSFKKKRLIEGLDNISLSMKKNLDIEKYENIMKKNKNG